MTAQDKEIGCCIGEKEEEAMDTRIWKNFPEELMGIVLARLPFLSLIRFRCVCKGWSRLLSSRTFLDEVYRNPRTDQETCWFLSGTFRQNRLAVYTASQRKWHIRTVTELNAIPFDATVVPEATMGGLVCLTKYSIQEDWETPIGESVIWNPLTNSCKSLPRTTRIYMCPGLFVVGMYVDVKAQHYKLVAVGNSCGGLDTLKRPANVETTVVVTEIYDSSMNAWKDCESLFPHPTVSRLTRCNVCCNGSVYSISSKPYTIIAFDMKAEVWREMEIPLLELECPNLVELYDRLYMVGGIPKDGSIRIWQILEHTDGRVQWIEVDRIPHELLELLVSKGSQPAMKHWQPTARLWRCVGGGDSLFLKYWGSQEVLMYSISRRSWSWLPVCDLDSKRYHYEWNGLAFSPGWMSA